MDRFRQMDTFLRVSRTGSFTAVAGQLSQSPAAVARHINDLEASLGVRLLNRSTRSISLTEAGRTYADLCERVAEEILRTEAALSEAQDSAAGSIKMIVPTNIGTMQLGDAVVEFSASNPNISISVVLEEFSSRPNDFVAQGYDIALRWGVDVRDSTLVSTQLGLVTRKLCASPAYLAQHGTPTDLTHLEQHNCLVHLDAYADKVWRFADRDQEIGVKVSGDFVANSSLILRKAVLRGRGLAVLPLYCIRDDLLSGDLVEVLPDHPYPPNPLALLYREKRLLPSRVRLFIDFLRQWFGRHPELYQTDYPLHR